MKLLEVEDLKVYYKTRKGLSRAVDGVSFSLDEGEYLGIVGESGCGKTTAAKAILRILPPNAIIAGGRVLFRERDLSTIDSRELQELRWKEISVIPQSAMNTLDPVYRVGDQIVEVIRIHSRMSKKDALEQTRLLFEKVGLEKSQLAYYPHQLSGGMRQRVTIASSLALDPALIIADEPTTGLDVIVQDQILELIGDLQRSLGKAMLLITHDIPLVAENCQRIAVMYAGRVMEYGMTAGVLSNSCNPYTLGLQNAFPQFHGELTHLISIPGSPPDLVNPPPGCRFSDRCPLVTDVCSQQEPTLTQVEPGHFSACHRLDQIERFRQEALLPETWKGRTFAHSNHADRRELV